MIPSFCWLERETAPKHVGEVALVNGWNQAIQE